MNHALHLEDASLRDPERIDILARRLGLQSPQAGQVIRIDTATESDMPIVASAAAVAVISSR